MASRPSLYPYWATTTTNLTGTGNTNKVTPKTSLRDIGWDLGQQPTCEEFNWQLNNIDQWVEYLDSVVYAATASDTANTLALRDSNSSFSVKQLTSTAPDGTKPFNVTSTTKVDNLNADLLDGYPTSQTATASTVVVRDSNGKVVSDLTGNADTAAKWQTARNLAFTGFAIGNANIDGSGNVSINLSQGAGSLHAMTKTLLLSTSSVNSSVSVNIPNSLFGGVTPSFVMFSANANSTTAADITGYTLNVGTSQNLANVLMACGTDDTDQGNGRIYAASTFVLPYSTTQDFYVAAGAYSAFTCTTNIYIVGYQL